MADLYRDSGVNEALRRLKDADAAMTSSPDVLSRLRTEVRALGRTSSAWNRGTAFALAAAVIVGLMVPAMWWRTGDTPGSFTGTSTAVAQEVTTEFFPLFYGSVPASSSHIVRMEVPRASLVNFGLLSGDSVGRIEGTVLADVIVGNDGLARAVRFVRPISQE